MRDTYVFTLSVRAPNGGKEFVCGFSVDARCKQAKCLAQYDLCGDSMTAMLASGIIPEQAQRVDRERERLASYVSEKLTSQILEAIKINDTHNGYPKERQTVTKPI